MARHGVFGGAVRLHPVAFESGLGVALTDVDGNTYLDFTSGTAVANLGHSHPTIAEAIASATRLLANVHDHATGHKARALEALASVTPPGLDVFNLFTSGTEAIEGAMRVAREVTGRQGFVSLADDFHGRTGSAASVSAGRTSNALRSPESLIVAGGCRAGCRLGGTPAECGLACAAFAEEAIAQNMPGGLAGAVVEPVQNRNGATTYPPGYLARLAATVRRHGGLLIFDEIATGFGRTGAWFAGEAEGVVPDILAIGKGLGNGFPISAVAVREEHRDALAAAFPSSTFGGNPVACAAAAAVIEVMKAEGLVEHAAEVGSFALARLKEMKQRHPIIGSVRGRGLLLGIELVTDRETMAPNVKAGHIAYVEGWRHGIAWSTYDHILRMAPPIVISKEDLARGLDLVGESIAVAEKQSAA
jgi:4-aminobutyrate aminotransferase-like enzyme